VAAYVAIPRLYDTDYTLQPRMSIYEYTTSDSYRRTYTVCLKNRCVLVIRLTLVKNLPLLIISVDSCLLHFRLETPLYFSQEIVWEDLLSSDIFRFEEFPPTKTVD